MTKNENQRTGLEDALSAGKTASDALRIGQAVSKGAAAGGPWGVAMAAAVEGREHIGKLLAGAGAILLIPVLFILMLPSLIFGGLSSSAAEGASLPVLNDTAAISTHLADTTAVVHTILGEGVDDAKTRIAAHFAETEGDNYEIIDPYEAGIDCNVNLFLSEYCAAKNDAWSDMMLADMETVLRSAKDQFFSFTYTTETREVEDDDPETEDVVETKTELWYIYTLVYNGEAQLADSVFHLTDAQKALADDYANCRNKGL